ncbi:beta-lactamase/transpeptidase-like protein [Gloeophyllum trabeum ATCC 11539]|uniref:Beta-lactamase/transpeptidase-like protein n=1 Tax=Gloeophyllum trabeum (strain ATCC 11539 / FP-39264 / Madison 617) TaxID=670483 RepID=S7S1E8_GLOTA|nr:beta-lactamase/transpeptidase-like protein [Gloeophyllum trabeum ATCC 11539]EPQ61275.1 beta-lactamase/transpeptidase-like protein [Gloeophyllum trabeum ATCC 11539]
MKRTAKGPVESDDKEVFRNLLHPPRRWQALFLITLCYFLFRSVPSSVQEGPLGDWLKSRSPSGWPRASCPYPFPNVVSSWAPTAESPGITAASKKLDKKLKARVAAGGIDGLAVSVVTSSGPLFEGTYGVVKANETDPTKRLEVDRHTIFRLASVTKMLTAMETWILRQRGALSWDDAITKFVPDFSIISDEEPINVRQLASHTAGIPGDMPPGPMTEWPHSLEGAGTPPENGLPFPAPEDVLSALANFRPVVPPSYLPVYSDTGYSLLGMVNLGANTLWESSQGDRPKTHAELLERDIFEPLGMRNTGFSSNVLDRSRIAVASLNSYEADYDFLEAMNPAGGCYSSLADLGLLAQNLLAPGIGTDLLTPMTVREWMRPLHAWYDDATETGLVWEIAKYHNSWGQVQRLYQKFGQLGGYHTAFSLNPTNGFAVIVLMTGEYLDSQAPTLDAVDVLQPAIDHYIAETVARMYSGRWRAESKDEAAASDVIISIHKGSLWAERIILNGTDVLGMIYGQGKTRKVGLFSTGRVDEFRLAFGIPPFNDALGYGCTIYSFGAEIGYSRGAPVNEMVFRGDAEGRILRVPSVELDLRRVH